MHIKRLTYYLLKGFVYALSLLPFCVLYALADVVFVLLYYLIRYRRRVVRSNLVSSFPDMPMKEVKRVERRFYRWLCDYFVETFKLLSMSDAKVLRHIEFRGVEQLEKVFSEGRNCAAILGHYCNWEWLSATGLTFKEATDGTGKPVTGLIYHPLRNDYADWLFIDIRSAHGGSCVSKRYVLRHLVELKREGRHSLFGYISDQTPKWENIHLWLDFLNHDTPVFTGGERIMRKMDDAVFYAEMERPCRGKYVCTFRLLADHAAQEEENAITCRFFQMLEDTIRREPAYYLWTHNRWKRTHAEYDAILEEWKLQGRHVGSES